MRNPFNTAALFLMLLASTAPPGAEEITVMLPGDVPLTLIRVPAGTFMMGSPEDERGRYDFEDLHQVTLTQDYYLGKYEVTQAQWQAVMGTNPSFFSSCGGSCPVERVSWTDIAGSGGFIEQVNTLLGTTAFRLPSDAEWERAARAGTQARFSHGDVLECGDGCEACAVHEQYMWWCGIAGDTTHPVGSLGANAYGLHDMHGNVFEWVQDRWVAHLGTLPVTDPIDPGTGVNRVLRGGGFYSNARYCRSAIRFSSFPDDRSGNIGFRLARSPDGGSVVPVASFSWSPGSPQAGQVVQFADTSTGPPTSWTWDFGDWSTSTDQNPTHAYAVAGTYTVSLTATNAVGRDTTSHAITVGTEPELDEFYFVAAAANAAGAAGSFFVTDLEVNNTEMETMSYRFLWLPRDTDNSNPSASDVFTLAGGASVRYENVLNEVFAASDVVGALAVVADNENAIIMSRTFNQGDTGTFGQAIEGLHSSELIQANERMRMVFMTETDGADVPTTGYRSNLGVLNGTGAPLTVMVARYDAAGNMLGDLVSVELDPWENTQLNRVLRSFDPPVSGYVDIWTETVGGAFTCYGSVLDNVTSDPTTVNSK